VQLTTPTPPGRPSRIEQAAPAAFVLLWSTGFVVARYATRDAGPLTFLTVRMVIASGALAMVSFAVRAPRIDRRTAAWAALAALGMHVLYLGGVFVAIDLGLPSGLSALIAGLHPAVTAVVASALLHERLRSVQWLGVGLGLVGVGLVVIERLSTSVGEVTGVALVAMGISVLGMSAGTLVQRSKARGMPLLWGTTVHYAAASVAFGLAMLLGEGFQLELTAQFAWSLLWGVVVLSIGAVLLMLWLLGRHAAARVSSLFFLTPALSAIEGAVLFGERLGWFAVAGLAVALVGVALTTRAAQPPV
jgi:drug/metabolite transporter (DMT)-like permease